LQDIAGMARAVRAFLLVLFNASRSQDWCREDCLLGSFKSAGSCALSLDGSSTVGIDEAVYFCQLRIFFSNKHNKN
jgi:hypothetical protein